jgi:hypothetical protein
MRCLFFLHICLIRVLGGNIQKRLLCHNCKHFIPSSFVHANLPGDVYGKCSKFFRNEHDDSEHEFASYARKDLNKCGEYATFFL